MVLYSNNSTLWWYYGFTVAGGEIPISGPTEETHTMNGCMALLRTNLLRSTVTPRASKLHLFVVGPVAKGQLAPGQEGAPDEVAHVHRRLFRHRDRRSLQLLGEAIAMYGCVAN